MIDAQRAPAPASASSVALPAFNSPWAMQHLQPAATPKPLVESQAPAPPSNRVLYAMITALTVTVASLGAYVVFRPPPLVVETAGATVPVIDPKLDLDPEVAAVAAKSGEADDEADDDAEDDAEDEAEDEAEAAATSTRVRRGDRTRTRTRTRTPQPDKTVTKPPKPKGDDLSVDCIIDPKKCNRTKKPPKPDDDRASTKDLPLTPSSSQIRSAMASVKPTAKACGPKHGGKSGEKVRVKLSAAGKTGRIISANALEAHSGTALGRCVASALKGATLPRFSKERAGIVYAVRL